MKATVDQRARRQAPDIPVVDNPTSTYAGKYVLSQTQPTESANEAILGLVQTGMAAKQAGDYERVVVSRTSRSCRRSEGGFANVNTEVYGTSPYLGRGDGDHYYVDVSNQLMRDVATSDRGSKVRSLINDRSPIAYTWSQIDVPLGVATTAFLAGMDSRNQLAYS